MDSETGINWEYLWTEGETDMMSLLSTANQPINNQKKSAPPSKHNKDCCYYGNTKPRKWLFPWKHHEEDSMLSAGTAAVR